MLLQTRFISKFTETIGAFQWAIVAAMSRLHMIVQEPFFREVFSTRHANKRSFTSMDSEISVKVGMKNVAHSHEFY